MKKKKHNVRLIKKKKKKTKHVMTGVVCLSIRICVFYH